MPGEASAPQQSGRWGPAPGELSDALRRKFVEARLVAFDFDGVMTDNRVYVDETGREMVACSRFEGFGLDRLRALDVAMCIISTEKNPVVAMRAAKLKLPVEHGVSDKVAMLTDFAAKFCVSMEQTVFVGNDVNDLPAFAAAGTAVAVADCHPAVTAHVDHLTHRPGGLGAVREICDLIADIKQGRD